jgi:hypothetical protein
MRTWMRVLAVTLLLLPLPAACGQGSAQGAAGPARVGDAIDQATVDRLYEQVCGALTASADITLPERVPALLLSAAEARERRKAFSDKLDEDAGVTSAIDLVADFVFAEGMLGRYLPDEQVLYIVRDVAERVARERGTSPADLLFAVMAHELVHAYDDQVHAAIPHPKDLFELSANGTRLPEIQARMSFVEGRATWAAELACRHAGRRELETHSVQEARDAEVLRARSGDSAAERAGKGFVNVVARAKLVQYAQGRSFAKAAWDFGGERFLGEVYAHMPLSLAELEDFERFKQRWAAEEEAALEAEESAGVEPTSEAEPAPAAPDGA